VVIKAVFLSVFAIIASSSLIAAGQQSASVDILPGGLVSVCWNGGDGLPLTAILNPRGDLSELFSNPDGQTSALIDAKGIGPRTVVRTVPPTVPPTGTEQFGGIPSSNYMEHIPRSPISKDLFDSLLYFFDGRVVDVKTIRLMREHVLYPRLVSAIDRLSSLYALQRDLAENLPWFWGPSSNTVVDICETILGWMRGLLRLIYIAHDPVDEGWLNAIAAHGQHIHDQEVRLYDIVHKRLAPLLKPGRLAPPIELVPVPVVTEYERVIFPILMRYKVLPNRFEKDFSYLLRCVHDGVGFMLRLDTGLPLLQDPRALYIRAREFLRHARAIRGDISEEERVRRNIGVASCPPGQKFLEPNGTGYLTEPMIGAEIIEAVAGEYVRLHGGACSASTVLRKKGCSSRGLPTDAPGNKVCLCRKSSPQENQNVRGDVFTISAIRATRSAMDAVGRKSATGWH
jgi:hypothetical protein